MSFQSKAAAHHRRFAALERLESREVLSANLGLAGLGASAHSAAAQHAAPTLQHVDISIVGTEVSYSPAGLPSDMKGDMYLVTAAGTSTEIIGTYDEVLQPIFAPVGPDGGLAFVGATGVCTFDFNLSFGKGGFLTVGSITAGDTALIEGALPDGTMFVGSADSPITASSGITAGLSGAFSGQSEVLMGAAFRMHTAVDFAVTSSRGVDVEEVLSGLAVANNAIAHGYFDPHLPQSLAHENGAAHAGVQALDRLADKYAAVDSVFTAESESPWNDRFVS